MPSVPSSHHRIPARQPRRYSGNWNFNSSLACSLSEVGGTDKVFGDLSLNLLFLPFGSYQPRYLPLIGKVQWFIQFQYLLHGIVTRWAYNDQLLECA